MGPTVPSSAGDVNCAAVSASTWVEPNGKCTVAFAIAWSSPKVKFMKGKSYHRLSYIFLSSIVLTVTYRYILKGFFGEI